MISLIIGFIAFVFVFYGVFSPKATRGMHSGAVAGKVNGDSISLSEFSRALQRRIEFFKSMGGNTLTEEQIRQYGIRQSVFGELVNRKLMTQEAIRQDRVPSDEEVRDAIRQMTVFQKDSKFDYDTYQRVLESNRYTPAGFERLMKEDLLLQHWEQYLKSRIHASDEEVRREFLVTKDKRNIKYVLFTQESGSKGIKVQSAELQKFLADAAKSNLAKGRYEAKKDKEYKGKAFDSVKSEIASEILASEKTEEIKKINDGLADQALALLVADKKSDAKVNALLKSYGVEVKTTGLIPRSSRYLPGVGDVPQLISDAFSKKSLIDPGMGGKAKKYSIPAGILVAIVSEAEKPDLSKLDAEREKLLEQVIFRKERELQNALIKKLSSHAKIERNEAVVDQKEDQTTDAPYDGG